MQAMRHGPSIDAEDQRSVMRRVRASRGYAGAKMGSASSPTIFRSSSPHVPLLVCHHRSLPSILVIAAVVRLHVGTTNEASAQSG